MTRNPRDTSHWSEDGCDLHGSCFTCPLPACRYEMAPGKARAFSQALALERLLAAGVTMNKAAADLGVSRSTAYRLRRLAKALL